MQVKITKAGHYAVHHAWGPNIDLVKDQEISTGQETKDSDSKITNEFITYLIDNKCAVIVEEKPKSDGTEGLEPEVAAVVKAGGGKNDIKKNLMELVTDLELDVEVVGSEKYETVLEAVNDAVKASKDQ